MYFVLFDKIKLKSYKVTKSYNYCYKQSVSDLNKIL